MGFDRTSLLSHRFAESRQSFTERDTILYALGLGIGTDPVDPRQLRFVYEDGLQALPTMGVVLAHPGFWAGDPALGIDWPRMLHVGQGLTIHRPIPASGEVIGRSRIADVIDRGEEKGALLYYERDVVDAASEELIATVRQTLLCRGNGGFEASGEAPKAPELPETAPDHLVRTPILPQAALLYRLSGDLNPLHADPAMAIKAGFAQPILHGLATYGMAGYAALNAFCDGNPSAFCEFDVRFTAPVMPGETLITELWDDGVDIALRARVEGRDAVVLDNGRVKLRGRPQADGEKRSEGAQM